MADWGLIGAVGQGLQSGVNSYQQAQQQQREALERKQRAEREDRMFKSEMRSKGYDVDTETGETTAHAADPEKVSQLQGLLGHYHAEGLLPQNASEAEYNNAAKAAQEFKERELGFRFRDTSVADAMKQERLDKMRRDEDDKNAQLEVGGYTREGSKIRPKVEEAADLRGAQATLGTFKNNMDQLSALIDKHGSNIMFGPDAAKARALASQAKLQIKDIAKLGALSQSDIELMEGLVQDPTDFGQLFTSDKSAKARLSAALEQAQSKVSERAKSLGYKPLNETPSSGVAENHMDRFKDTSIDDIDAAIARKTRAASGAPKVNAGLIR